MEYYIGLDVSQRQTAICIIDGQGKRVVEEPLAKLARLA